MRIGILTFHNVPNYGAALQAFAMKSYLSSFGHTVQIIDYQCPGNNGDFEPENRKKIFITSNNPAKKIAKWMLYKFFSERDYVNKYKKFVDFYNTHYALEKDTRNIFNRFDLVFCGSDQIWNPVITGGFCLPYFGQPVDRKAIVASYAASCGDISEFDEEVKEVFFHNIQSLNYISVREKSLSEAIKMHGIHCICSLDPTFLLTASEYIEKLGLEKKSKSRYLLQYSLQKNGKLDQLAKRIAKEKNLQIINICGYMKVGPGESGSFDTGPLEFMEAIYGADYVVTNSFHGVALSLIFEKNFNVVLPSGRQGRILDLLEMLSLKQRISKQTDEAVTDTIDYLSVNAEIEHKINESKQYINTVMEHENE